MFSSTAPCRLDSELRDLRTLMDEINCSDTIKSENYWCMHTKSKVPTKYLASFTIHGHPTSMDTYKYMECLNIFLPSVFSAAVQGSYACALRSWELTVPTLFEARLFELAFSNMIACNYLLSCGYIHIFKYKAIESQSISGWKDFRSPSNLLLEPVSWENRPGCLGHYPVWPWKPAGMETAKPLDNVLHCPHGEKSVLHIKLKYFLVQFLSAVSHPSTMCHCEEPRSGFLMASPSVLDSS